MCVHFITNLLKLLCSLCVCLQTSARVSGPGLSEVVQVQWSLQCHDVIGRVTPRIEGHAMLTWGKINVMILIFMQKMRKMRLWQFLFGLLNSTFIVNILLLYLILISGIKLKCQMLSSGKCSMPSILGKKKCLYLLVFSLLYI